MILLLLAGDLQSNLLYGRGLPSLGLARSFVVILSISESCGHEGKITAVSCLHELTRLRQEPGQLVRYTGGADTPGVRHQWVETVEHGLFYFSSIIMR